MAIKQGEELWNETVDSPNTCITNGTFAGSCWDWSANSIVDPTYLRESANGGVYFECREPYFATCTGSPEKHREQIRLDQALNFLNKFNVGQWYGFSFRVEDPGNSGTSIIIQRNGDGAPEMELKINGDGNTFDLSIAASDSNGVIDYTNSKLLDNFDYVKNAYNDVVIFQLRERTDDGIGNGRIKVWVNSFDINNPLVSRNQPNGIDYLAQGKNGTVRLVPGIYPSDHVLASGSTIKLWMGPIRIASGLESEQAAMNMVLPGQQQAIFNNPPPAGTQAYTILDTNFTLPDSDSTASWGLAQSTTSYSGWVRFIAGENISTYEREAVFTWSPGGAGNSDVYFEVVPKSDRALSMPVYLYQDYGGANQALLATKNVNIQTTPPSWVLLKANQYHGNYDLSVVVRNTGLDEFVAVDGISQRYVAETAGSDVSFTFVDDTIYDTATTTYTVDIPTSGDGLSAGDIMFIYVAACGDNSFGEMFTTPTGWSSYCNTRSDGDDADRASKLFYKVATGSESGTVSVTVAESVVGKIVSFFGTNIPSSGIFSTTDTHAVNADGTNHLSLVDSSNVIPVGAVSPSAEGAILTLVSGHYGVIANTNAAASGSNDGSETKIYSSPDDGATAYMPWVYISYKVVAAAGSVASHNVTFASTDNDAEVDSTVIRLGVNKAATITNAIDVPDSTEWSTSPSDVTKNYASTIFLDPIGTGEFSGGSEEFILLQPTDLVGCSAYIDRGGANDRLAINVDYGFDGTLSLTLPVSDTTLSADGGPLTDSCTVSFEVTNTAPTASDWSITVLENTASTDFSIPTGTLGSDSDGDSLTMVLIVDTDGVVGSVSNGVLNIDSTGISGPASKTLTYQFDDGSNNSSRSSTKNINITVAASAGTITGETFSATCTRSDEEVVIDFLTDGNFSDTASQTMTLKTVNGSACTASGGQIVTTTYGFIECANIDGVDKIKYTPTLGSPYGATVQENISLVITNGTNDSAAVTMQMSVTTTVVSGRVGWITGWRQV